MSVKIIQRISLIVLISNFASASDANTGEFVPRVGNPGEFNRGLTDEEAVIAKDFVHNGKVQRDLEEACNTDKDTKAACDGDEATVFGETGDLVFQTAAQMYSLFGLGSGSLGVSDDFKKEMNDNLKPQAEGESSADFAKRQEKGQEMKEQSEQADYCKYIPAGVSLVAQGYQALSNKSISTDVPEGQQSIAQKEFLYKKERVHKERAKTASIEAAGWGSTAVCYTALAASSFGLSNASTGTYVKIGAATFLTAFFYKRMQNNKKYAKKVKAIADALPGQGDCNPITERECYCSQEETSQDPQYCIPQIAGAPPAAPGTQQIQCVNSSGQLDDTCACRASNSCLDQNFSPVLTDFGTIGGASSLIRPAQNLVNGRLQTGSLSGTAAKQQAFSKKALADIDKNVDTSGIRLNPTQKRKAAMLRRAGIPSRMAAKLATTPVTARGLELARRNGISAPELASSEYKATKNVFTNKKSKKRVVRANPFKRNRKRNGSRSVLRFAEQADKAQRRAIINKDRGKNVFEIITYRYQKSGWEKLDYILE